MENNSDLICLCPLEGIINTIAKKWAILIITIIGHHERIRFNDIMTTMEGISPKTLSDLLKALQKENLISRESFAETPPRVEYSLTDDGKQLCEAIIPLIRWAEKRDNLHKKRCEANCQSHKCIAHHVVKEK
ncbi:MAG: transcriptional regulator [Methanomicrobiales archaeon HGW-Methanomicrobiales-4]|nr:MAG: transcriptional regulator [Methanomicrobiales archaeon HGW-Methanomicrobiales-4]